MELSENTSRMTLREWLSLLGLTFAAFIFNTSEFVPVGLLSDIAADFSLTTAAAGMLISVYAWVVMLLSLPLMILASRMEMRRLMLLLVGGFAFFQVCSFLSSSYAMLMASRIGVACAHSVFWSIASPMAARLVSSRHRSLALSMVTTGSSIAMIFGVPIGRIIGLQIGWRMTFLSIGIVAAFTFAYMLFTMPQLPSRGKFSVKKLPTIFACPPLVGIFVLSAFFATAYYTGYSYIEPFMKHVGHMPDALITTALMCFGVAGIGGSVVFARYYNRHRYGFQTIMLTTLMLCLALLLPFARSAAATFALLLAWGVAATAFNIAMQCEIIQQASAEATSVAMSIFSGIFNFGIGTGAFIGGRICSATQVDFVGIGGAIIALGALAYWWFCLRVYLKRAYAAKA